MERLRRSRTRNCDESWRWLHSHHANGPWSTSHFLLQRRRRQRVPEDSWVGGFGSAVRDAKFFEFATFGEYLPRLEGAMTTKHLRIAANIAVLLQFGAGAWASAAPLRTGVEIGTKFPDDFPVIRNFYLGQPVIGFGSDIGRIEHVPVIFLHGNNDTPFATACNPFGRIQAFAQFFLDHGYRPSELWGLGYQGDQCDLVQDNTHRSGVSHTTAAAVPILREFVQAVLDFTGAKRVDIVATVSASPWPGNGCCRTMPIARCGRSSPSTDPIMASLTARPARPTSTSWRAAAASRRPARYATSTVPPTLSCSRY